MTRVSVVIPVHKSEQCIRETIESVLSQTHPPHELVIVDDGSTDGTEAIVRSFGDRLIYIRQASQGVSAARNRGIAVATGEWIAFLDHDDLMLPEKLEKQIRVIESNPELICVYSAFKFLYTDGSTKEVPSFPAKDLWPALRYRTPILPSTAIVKRSALLAIDGFRKVYAEDWNLWFRLVQKFGAENFQNSPECLTLYRWWANNTSHNSLTIMQGVLDQVDSVFLADMSGLRRLLWKRRIVAKQYYNASLGLREQKDERYLSYAIRSILSWPLFGTIAGYERYPVLFHMLLNRRRFSTRASAKLPGVV